MNKQIAMELAITYHFMRISSKQNVEERLIYNKRRIHIIFMGLNVHECTNKAKTSTGGDIIANFIC